MAKKRTAKKAAQTTEKAGKKAQDEQIVLGPGPKKALRLVDKSAKVRAGLEDAVTAAITKAVRKCMKENGIELTSLEGNVLATIWFGEED
jgi:anthranilate/para-aminobenzoate synthase component II